MKFEYELTMKVRDYECDLQGIVNNANYQHYTEHCRHEFLLSKGISFSELHERGIDAVVSRITIDYKVPLKSKDEFVVRLHLERDGVKYVFFQNIYRLCDDRLCVRAKIETVCVDHGVLMRGCPELDAILVPGEG